MASKSFNKTNGNYFNSKRSSGVIVDELLRGGHPSPTSTGLLKNSSKGIPCTPTSNTF
jgi:hypothetical protein